MELCRQKRPGDARDHARRYFQPYIESQHKKILWAAGLLAHSPEQQTHYSVSAHHISCIKQLIALGVVVFASALERASCSLHRDPSSAFLASLPSTSSHRSLSRSVSPQDSFLPFKACQQHRECQLDHDISLSDLFARAKRGCPQITLCSPYQELR